MESDNVKINEKIKNYQSILDKKQIEIDELEKQLKSLAAEYSKMEQKVCSYVVSCT